MSEHTLGKVHSRRSFLLRAGAGAATITGVTAGAGAPTAVAARSWTVTTSPTTFGRIFPRLAPFAAPTDAVRRALNALGAKGGPLDANDDLAAGPVLLITDLSKSANNPNNPAHTAGTTFFGQYVDHDITFDTTSPLGVPADPETSPNSRTPSLDLDSLYGAGPVSSAHLFDPFDRAKLRISSGGIFEDLVRDESGAAIIADPRNDEQMIINGLVRLHPVPQPGSRRGSGGRRQGRQPRLARHIRAGASRSRRPAARHVGARRTRRSTH